MTVPAQKSRVIAGVFAIVLGSIGLHKFYLGYVKEGLIMLGITLIGSVIAIGPAVMGTIGLIEGILYLVKSAEDFDRTYVLGSRGWF